MLELEVSAARLTMTPSARACRLIMGAPLPDARRQGGLLAARQQLATALMKQLDRGGDLVEAVGAHLDNAFSEDPPAHEAMLKALDAARDLKDLGLQDVAKRVCAKLAYAAQEAQKAVPASCAPREAPRMPNDVLVHLAVVVGDAAKRHSDDAALKHLARDLKMLFMSHGSSIETVRALSAKAAGRLEQLKEHAAADQCFRLAQQMPMRELRGEATSLNRQQLHDNLYGRVFDSRFMQQLVDDPPAAVLSSTGAMSAAFAKRLDQEGEANDAAAAAVRDELIGDPRPWMDRVPGLTPLLAATEAREARCALAAYLRSPVLDGPDAVSRTLLMIRAGVASKTLAVEAGRSQDVPTFLQRSDEPYRRVALQATRQEMLKKGSGVRTHGTGITLRHQPVAIDDPSLRAAVRPIDLQRVGDDKVAPGHTHFSSAVDVQHNRAPPFSVGVSGTTNGLMHLLAEMRDSGEVSGVAARDLLLAIGMTLTYDGGHSLHETLWTGNMLDKELGLDLQLSDGTQAPTTFVSDYGALVEGFPSDTRDRLRVAMDRAWSGTQDYLRQHSHFARATA
ncbi:hypothetical protein CDL60_26920 [Roseateles noduli]|nr:hypothetical protein CDL60_26920 [Roseateles noduli]